jgi:hypothetical protein
MYLKINIPKIGKKMEQLETSYFDALKISIAPPEASKLFQNYIPFYTQ